MFGVCGCTHVCVCVSEFWIVPSLPCRGRRIVAPFLCALQTGKADGWETPSLSLPPNDASSSGSSGPGCGCAIVCGRWVCLHAWVRPPRHKLGFSHGGNAVHSGIGKGRGLWVGYLLMHRLLTVWLSTRCIIGKSSFGSRALPMCVAPCPLSVRLRTPLWGTVVP